jgi:hypothetical protein
MPVVSQDPHLPDLVKRNRVDVVMSSGVLNALIGNHPPSFLEEWQIPIQIMEQGILSLSLALDLLFRSCPLRLEALILLP